MGFDPGRTGNPNPTAGIFTSLRLNGRHLHHPDPVHLLPMAILLPSKSSYHNKGEHLSASQLSIHLPCNDFSLADSEKWMWMLAEKRYLWCQR